MMLLALILTLAFFAKIGREFSRMDDEEEKLYTDKTTKNDITIHT